MQFPLLTGGVVIIFFDVSRFPILLQFHIKAKRTAHHRHGL